MRSTLLTVCYESFLPAFGSKKLLEYACFHKADLEEADRDKDGTDDSSHSDGHGHGGGGGGKGISEFDAYSHKVYLLDVLLPVSAGRNGRSTQNLCCIVSYHSSAIVTP